MGLFLGSLFCSICLYVCFYGSTMLCCLNQYSLIVKFLSGSMIPPTLFFLNIAESIFLWFHIHFWNICFSSVKYAIKILIGIVLNLSIALGSLGILIPIHGHYICFHLFVSSSISFFSIL